MSECERPAALRGVDADPLELPNPVELKLIGQARHRTCGTQRRLRLLVVAAVGAQGLHVIETKRVVHGVLGSRHGGVGHHDILRATGIRIASVAESVASASNEVSSPSRSTSSAPPRPRCLRLRARLEGLGVRDRRWNERDFRIFGPATDTQEQDQEAQGSG